VDTAAACPVAARAPVLGAGSNTIANAGTNTTAIAPPPFARAADPTATDRQHRSSRNAGGGRPADSPDEAHDAPKHPPHNTVPDNARFPRLRTGPELTYGNRTPDDPARRPTTPRSTGRQHRTRARAGTDGRHRPCPRRRLARIRRSPHSAHRSAGG